MAAGDTYTIFKPRIFIAAHDPVTPVKLPAMNLPLGGVWPTGWFQVKHTEEGVSISSNVEKEDIESDEADQPLGVAATSSAINISWTSVTPNLDLVDFLGNMLKEEYAAVTNADPTLSYPAHERHHVVLEGTRFMVGVEGEYASGGLTDNGGFVRAFAYNVEQTEEFEMRMSRKGSDAAFRPAATVRCLPKQLAPEQTAGTGIQEVDSTFDLFVVPTTA